MLTNLTKVRIEIGDTENPPFQILSDEEILYFLEKNADSVKRASLDCAKTILFKLARLVDERADVLEMFGSQYFRAYKEALMVYLKDQNFSVANACMPYAGGISKTDVQNNIDTSDNIVVSTMKGIPQEGDAYNMNTDFFTQVQGNRDNPFGY